MCVSRVIGKMNLTEHCVPAETVKAFIYSGLYRTRSISFTFLKLESAVIKGIFR